MKKYEVTLKAHYQKTVSVYADSPEEAKEKLGIVLFDTDLVAFSEDDFVCGEADIEDAEKPESRESDMGDGCLGHDDCSGCPCRCPVCGECLYGDGE